MFEEVPDEITLALNITNCQNRCVGCHSPELRKNIGEELTKEKLDALIAANDGITCVCFMGEGNDFAALLGLSNHIRAKYPYLKKALYSGRNIREGELRTLISFFDYIKVGEYKPECGPLNNPKTNQRMYKFNDVEIVDITSKFWKKT